jgi:hypothetical protein
MSPNFFIHFKILKNYRNERNFSFDKRNERNLNNRKWKSRIFILQKYYLSSVLLVFLGQTLVLYYTSTGKRYTGKG